MSGSKNFFLIQLMREYKGMPIRTLKEDGSEVLVGTLESVDDTGDGKIILWCHRQGKTVCVSLTRMKDYTMPKKPQSNILYGWKLEVIKGDDEEEEEE